MSTTTSLAEIKNGKVIFKQKPISFEKQSETLQEIVAFREMLEKRVQDNIPLTAIPKEYQPVVAKLAHESDKTIGTLAKNIQNELFPIQDGDEDPNSSSFQNIFPQIVVEATIRSALERNNYGLDPPSGVKHAASFCAWRWEVKSEFWEWLPKNAREKAEQRLADRIQAKKDLFALFTALPDSQQNAIIPGYKPSIAAPSNIQGSSIANAEPVVPNGATPTVLILDSPPSNSQQPSSAPAEEDAMQSDAGQLKNAGAAQKSVKDKERSQKRAAKAEKDKKEKQAADKSRSIMANFFTKPKIVPSVHQDASSRVGTHASSSTLSDFEKTFKPFILKKGTDMAPMNWFSHQAQSRDVIIIDDDKPTTKSSYTTEANLCLQSPSERLRFILSSLPSPARQMKPFRPSLTSQNRGVKLHGGQAVRNVFAEVSDAEFAGDVPRVRMLTSTLADRSVIPAKVFIFREDARPGYFGTWTRSSRIIGPRRPLARSVQEFDYGYDSGEEWEDEGVDAEDVVEDGDEDDGETEDRDSDLDDWLIDDDDEPGTPLEDRNTSPLLTTFPVTQKGKRKGYDSDKKDAKKRKVVIPLVPLAKGPYWESTVGQSPYDPFNQYHIRLFNDTPICIDPFTFVSTAAQTTRSRKQVAAAAAPADKNAVPASSESGSQNLTGSHLPGPGTVAPKKAPGLPKTTFPDDFLHVLYDKITALQAASLTFLVENIYSELRVHKVKKNAIEAKIKEVSEKSKDKKFWVLKSGIVPPAQQALSV